jgi:(p)ppGpp synthase/HD superfamily hydrolase
MSTRLYDALLHAVALHGNDVRKGSQIPVLSHLLNVCAIVQADGGSEDEAIAALLHDAIEDKPGQVSDATLANRYGSRVARMVRAATDTPRSWRGKGRKPSWLKRKKQYLARVVREQPSFLRPTVADKIDNVTSILRDYARHGEDLWSRFNAGKKRQLWYYRACCDAYKQAGASRRLVKELDGLIVMLEEAAGGTPQRTSHQRRGQ